MRRLLTANLATLAATALLASAAYAQNPATLTVSVLPTKSASKSKPRKASLNLHITNDPSAFLTASRLDVFFARHVRISASGLVQCDLSSYGNSAVGCPPGSQVGTGTATAVLGQRTTPGGPATLGTTIHFKLVFFATGDSQLALDLQGVENPAVRVTIPLNITSLPGKFGQKMVAPIPTQIQNPAPGLFAALTDLNVNLSKSVRRGGRVRSLISTRGCPSSREWPFQTTLTFTGNSAPPPIPSAPLNATAPCKKPSKKRGAHTGH